MSKLTLSEVEERIAPAVLVDLDGQFEVSAPEGFSNLNTDTHYVTYDYKSKWFKKSPFQTEEEWAEAKRVTPTKLQALRIVLEDWEEDALEPCEIVDCDWCNPEEECE